MSWITSPWSGALNARLEDGGLFLALSLRELFKLYNILFLEITNNFHKHIQSFDLIDDLQVKKNESFR